MAAPFRIYNTLSRRVEDFEPLEPGRLGLYVCGMTVYDHAHVGHARAMVVFDTFVRYLRHRGWQVRFVRNFTDVDDKIIARARENGEAPQALAQRFIDAFHAETELLGLMRPDEEPRVTERIESIRAMIEELVEKGHAYAAEGSVWFSVESDPEYGKLSGQKPGELRSADPESGKRSPADFALWKASKPGEPSWPSAWGPGRPGWHIECSSMARDTLGETIDIHGGGLDLVFPHHENEVAQSESAHGCTYARYWMHNGLLTMSGGEKMGKSLGNVINVCDALVDFPAEALRLYYLQNHYRSPLPWGEHALAEALGMLARLYEAREVAEAMGGEEDADRVASDLGKDAQSVLELGRDFEARFHEAMDADFNTAKALGQLFELARGVNRFGNHKKAKKRGGPVVAPALEAFALVGEAINLMTMSSDGFQAEVKAKRLKTLGITPEEIDAELAARSQAREAKDWARADEIRDDLEARGIVIMDRPDRVDWRVRL
jgi:cysteinyl-tRNA synthetase